MSCPICFILQQWLFVWVWARYCEPPGALMIVFYYLDMFSCPLINYAGCHKFLCKCGVLANGKNYKSLKISKISITLWDIRRKPKFLKIISFLFFLATFSHLLRGSIIFEIRRFGFWLMVAIINFIFDFFFFK